MQISLHRRLTRISLLSKLICIINRRSNKFSQLQYSNVQRLRDKSDLSPTRVKCRRTLLERGELDRSGERKKHLKKIGEELTVAVILNKICCGKARI